MATLQLAIDARGAQAGANAFQQSTNKVSSASKRAGKDIARLDKRASLLARTFKKIAGPLAGLVTIFAAFSIVTSAISTISQFETTIATLQGVTSATSDQLQILSDTARELGATTQFSATQAGEGLLFLARAGFTVEESIEALPATLDLALAGMLDLGEAADIASNVLKAFQLATTETVRVVDTLVNTANSANTNVRQLAEAMKFVAPAAQALEISIEKTAAAIGVLGDAGIQGGMAGTNLRAVFAALSSQTEKTEKALGGLGLTFSDVNIESNDLIEIFERLSEANLGFGDAVKIFGRRNATVALILAASTGRIRELTKANEEAGGVARKNAALIEQTLGGAFKALISVVQETILILGESGFLLVLKSLVQTTTNVIRILIGMEDAVTRADTVARVMAGTIKALTVVLVTLIAVKIVAFFVAFKFALISLNLILFKVLFSLEAVVLGILAASGPIGLFVLGVGALVAAFVFLNTVWGDNIDTMGNLQNEIDGTKTSFNSLVSLLEQKQVLIRAGTPAEALIDTQKALIKDIKRQVDFLNKERIDLATLLDEASAEGLFTEFISVFTGRGTNIEEIAKLSNEVEINADAFGTAKAALQAFEEGLERLNLNIVTEAFTKQENSLKGLIEAQRLEGQLIGKDVNLQAVILIGRKLAALGIKGQTDELRKLKTALIESTLANIAHNDELEKSKRIDEATKSLGDFIENLEFENKLLVLNTRERTIAVGIRKAELILRAAELEITGEQITKITDLIDKNIQLRALEEKRPKRQRLDPSEIAKGRIDELFKELQFERSLIGKTNNERELAIRLLELENLEREAGTLAIDSQTEAYKKELIELQKFRELEQVANDIGAAFGNAFSSAIKDAENFKEIILGLLSDLQDIALQEFVSKPIKDSVSNIFGNIISSLFGTPISPSGGISPGGPQGPPNILALPPTFGPPASDLLRQSFSHGGIVSSPTEFISGSRVGLMGERGPEAIMPLSRGVDGRLGVAAPAPQGRNVTIAKIEMNFPGVRDPQGFRQSRSQITSGVRNALQRGAEQT